MIRKYVLTLLAAAGFLLGVYTVMKGARRMPHAQPVAMPAAAPFASYVAGAALVEASTENIAIGAIVPGVVAAVHARVGEDVKAGDPLFTVDDREARAELAVREAAVRVAEQSLARLEALPRAEEIPPAKSRVAEAEALLRDVEDLYARMEGVADRRAVSEEELSRRRFAVQVSKERLEAAKSELALLMAGAFAPEVEVARAQVDSARANADAARVEIERRTVRAPVSGRLLQVKVRAGEFAPGGALDQPLMLMGDVRRLHVRIDIDENDAWRITPGAPAVAFVRGNNALRTDLEFVRIEPYVVPKRSLTGASSERVDTRVLQAVYSFDPKSLPVYVGQQMDVFIEAAPVGSAAQTAPQAPGAVQQ